MTGVLCPPQSRVTRQVFGDEPRRASPLFVDGHHGAGQHVQHREVVAPHEGGDPRGVEAAHPVQRHEEDQQGAQAEGNGRLFHQGDAPAVLVPALVGAGGDQRVCHRVDDVTHRLDHADDGQHAQHQPSLRDEVGDTRCLGGLVEIDEIVIQHGRKKAHRKLRKAQPYDEGGVDFSHFSPCLLSLM